MGLFGPSKNERFVLANSRSLATYLKNNAVKFGGEAYAKLQATGVFPKNIDKQTLWYFWSCVFAYRAACDTIAIRREISVRAAQVFIKNVADIDNESLGTIDHGQYPETFSGVNLALELLEIQPKPSEFEQASPFMLLAVKAISGLDERERRFTVVHALIDATLAFPSVLSVVKQNA